MKNCKNCDKITDNPKFCSLSCSNLARKHIRYNNNKTKYNKNPIYCDNCKTAIDYERRRNKYCSHSCSAKITNLIPRKKSGPEKTKFPFRKVDFIVCDITSKVYCSIGPNGGRRQMSPYIKTEKEQYYEAAKFRFNVFDFPNHLDLSLLEKHGWYTCPGKKRKNYAKNINGVSRDHIVSISEGFKKGYDPKHLAHPANCRLMIHLDNKRKHDKSNMTYIQLLEKIENWLYTKQNSI